ncbi:hypothetical protein VIGAN_02278000 [Vigna angularis var. angularis]|uniref:Secreted protein n=1 Tax=Vigna angularis var. angularis TaxID=157739 RepID=A0A0S3RH15_PHAAN|nr:hypothetical protein VIGAN_02278000 [Vigna angularis var. angularis]
MIWTSFLSLLTFSSIIIRTTTTTPSCQSYNVSHEIWSPPTTLFSMNLQKQQLLTLLLKSIHVNCVRFFSEERFTRFNTN